MRVFSIAFLLVVFVQTVVFSAETDPSLETIRYPIQLYLQKDYYRTISEILKLEFTYPDQEQIKNLRPYLVKSYFHMNEFEKVLLLTEETLREKELYRDSISTEIASLATIVLLKQGKDYEAKKLWEREISGEPDLSFPLNTQVPDQINPDRARLYSSLLPGSGLLFSKEYGRATVSFFLNGLFIAGCYHYARKKQWGVAGLLFFFEIGWYKGGINAAEEGAINFNNRLIAQYQNRWIERNIGTIH